MLRMFSLLVVCSAVGCAAPPPEQPVARCELAANEQSAEAFVRAGSDFVRQARAKSEPGLYRHAEACVREALARESEHAGALRLHGLVMLNDHRFAEARELAKRLVAREPGDALSWGTLSDAQLELGNLSAAIEAGQRMLDLKPNLPSYGRAAHLRWLQGDVTSAMKYYELAIASGTGQRDPEPRAWMIVQAAWVFWHEGDYAGAAAGFELALRALPDYAPALEGRGRTALAAGDYAAAVTWLERAHRARPLAETAWALGDAHALRGERPQAEKYYAEVERRGRAEDPRSLSLFLAIRGREPAVALELARAEFAARRDLYTKDALAFALYRDGRHEEANQLAGEILASGIPDARLRYRAGLIRSTAARDAGQRDAGGAVARDALRKNPGLDRILTGGKHGLALAQNG